MELLLALSTALAKICILTLVAYGLSLMLTFYDNQRHVFLIPCLVGATILVAVYNVVIYPNFVDPLRKFPLVKVFDARVLFPITDLPRGKSALEWAKLHPSEDAIRIRARAATTVLMPLSVAAFRDVLTTNQHDFEKPSAGRNYLSRFLGYGLILSEGALHARQRKTLTSSFRIQNIRALHPLIRAKTDLMIERMYDEAQKNGRIEVTKWASRVTLDIIGKSLMSKEFDSLTVPRQPVNEAFTKLTTASPGQTIHFALGLLLPKFVVELLPTKTNQMLRENASIIRSVCQKCLSESYTKDGEAKSQYESDILTSIVKDPFASRDEVVDQMMTFLGAGHETTATSIAWASHLLTLPENIHYQDLVRSEVRSSVGCVDSPVALESLPWLNAVCEETLRLFPPVTNTARKAIRDTVIAGTRVPKDTVVVLYPWAANRNPRYWGGSDAERFVPERWITKSSDGNLRLNKHGGAESNFCELTFLHGGRSCIGRDFAKAELRCILARLLENYRLARLPGDNYQVEPVGSITIKPADGLFVTLEKIL